MMWLEDAKFRGQLAKLQKDKRKVGDYYDPKIAAAREAKQWEQEQMHSSEMFHELDMVEAEIRWLQHRYVTRQAERLLVPIPKFGTKSDSWLQSDHDGRWRLNDDVLDVVGQRVRQERRERIELLFLWPSAFIGFIGGVTGIVSALFF
ncbi:hypothetical protein SAMN05444358_1011706 [Ruegeria halocynthiae]|uniref:Uncharacterized protein n=2 Tax=Ruegeria halocynthiae TaxID=985054 RepID=A0A1H2W8D3_9RHOB|nr:hypothetical protein SAMN05444358_1011706 [Ruegeria halocynthiae]